MPPPRVPSRRALRPVPAVRGTVVVVGSILWERPFAGLGREVLRGCPVFLLGALGCRLCSGGAGGRAAGPERGLPAGLGREEAVQARPMGVAVAGAVRLCVRCCVPTLCVRACVCEKRVFALEN